VPAPIGIALDLHPIRAASEAAADVAVAIDAEQNGLFLDPVLHGCYPSAARPERVPPSALIRDHDMSLIGAPVDFLGINYYSPHYVRLGSWDDLRRGESPHEGRHGVVNYTPPEVPTTVMGWLIEPDGLFEVLTVVDSEAPHLPLYITENGCAADDYFTPEGQVNDFERIDYLHGHLDAASRAIEAGVNLKGYFVWSLMDNFEWSRGYKRRFGVYYVDYLTQRRLPKRSARFYADVVRTGALPAVEHQPTAVPVHAGPAV
jgi:beta-glucosidase